MSIYRSFAAHLYDLMMARPEKRCLGRWRSELLSDLHGEVLEIGAGTGVNLTHYPQQLARLVLCEPDPAMFRKLSAALESVLFGKGTLIRCAAEALPVPEQSFDYLVSTLVFCSVNDPQQAAAEAFRILRPGGCLIVIEHVAAARNTRLHFWQRLWQPAWKRIACNCHLQRTTARCLERAGFVLQLREEIMRGVPAIASPLIVGRAIRP